MHLCIDMQLMFAAATEWQVPWMPRILPAVQRLAETRPEQTVFTRFLPPDAPERMPGTWQRYWRRWEPMLRGRIDPTLLELPAELLRVVPPAVMVDKAHYSPFLEPALPHLLRERGTTKSKRYSNG